MPYPYSFIEEWWGETLSPDLIRRVAKAPRKHLGAFLEDLEFVPDRLMDIPSRPEGALRPLLRPIRDSTSYEYRYDYSASILMALNILLYAHEVIIEAPHLSTHKLHRQMSQLLEIKPLVDAGIMHLGVVDSRARHPSVFLQEFSAPWSAMSDSIPELYAALGPDDFNWTVMEVVGIVSLASKFPARANPVARDEAEYEIMTALLREAWTDRTYFDLKALARLSVPNLNGKISELVSVRQSEESFADWREALSKAITQLNRIPDDGSNWQRDARDMINSELQPLRHQIARAGSRTNALSVLSKGRTAMVIAGAGIAAGWAAGGNPASAVASSGATTGITMATAYLKALKERRQNKAILELALAFNRGE